MADLQLIILLILTNCIIIASPASNLTCPLPDTAKTGDIPFVKVEVYLCLQFNETAEPRCEKNLTEQAITVKKGLITNLDYDIHNYSLLAKFFGRELCVSYRIKTNVNKPGAALTIYEECGKDCFIGNKMIVFEIEKIYGLKSEPHIEKVKLELNFVVKSGSQRIYNHGRTYLIETCLALVICLIKLC